MPCGITSERTLTITQISTKVNLDMTKYWFHWIIKNVNNPTKVIYIKQLTIYFFFYIFQNYFKVQSVRHVYSSLSSGGDDCMENFKETGILHKRAAAANENGSNQCHGFKYQKCSNLQLHCEKTDRHIRLDPGIRSFHHTSINLSGSPTLLDPVTSLFDVPHFQSSFQLQILRVRDSA